MKMAVPCDSHFAVVFGELKFEKLGLGKQTHIHKHILRELRLVELEWMMSSCRVLCAS